MQLKLVKTYRAVDPRDGWGIAGVGVRWRNSISKVGTNANLERLMFMAILCKARKNSPIQPNENIDRCVNSFKKMPFASDAVLDRTFEEVFAMLRRIRARL